VHLHAETSCWRNSCRFADPTVLDLFAQFERGVYAALAA
jgi:hypothetical protein